MLLEKFGSKGTKLVKTIKSIKSDMFDIKLKILETQRSFFDLNVDIINDSKSKIKFTFK